MPDDMSPRAETQRVEPAPTTAPAAAQPSAAPASAKPGRKRLFGLLAAVVLLAAVGYGAYYVLVLSNFVSTDDAYVGADVAQITPQVAGQIQEVRVQDTQAVKKGDILVVIDPADADLAVAQAQAQYGQAVRRVRQYLANNQASTAQITARDADLKRAAAQVVAAQSDVERTAIDLKRREALEASGAVSGEELTTARNAYQTAVANLAAARAGSAQTQASRTVAQGQLASGLALTEGVDVENNPEVMAAKAALDTALLNKSRTILRAPFDGVVAQRQVQVGQRVAIGVQLMTVVPVSKVYVDANFKEMQLRKVKIGQPVELTADRWGSGVKFHGRVLGLAGGTGSAFAVIPAQNATGNWIKVVQRLPVRILLDERELEQHPLRVGLSVDAAIDVGAKGEGRPVEDAAR
ncbi:MAG: HlyD family efflux transporter periplasmic adaptor subunit [Caulobacteraceae bacterium]